MVITASELAWKTVSAELLILSLVEAGLAIVMKSSNLSSNAPVGRYASMWPRSIRCSIAWRSAVGFKPVGRKARAMAPTLLPADVRRRKSRRLPASGGQAFVATINRIVEVEHA
jgi:hypothetical protein